MATNPKSNSVLNLPSAMAHKIEKWLWKRGIYLPQIRALLRDQICFVILCLAAAIFFIPFSAKVLHFTVGSFIFTFMFGGIAKHLLSLNLNGFSTGLFMFVLLGTTIRLGFAALILYVALIMYDASAMALAGGVTASMAIALGTFAREYLGHKQ